MIATLTPLAPSTAAPIVFEVSADLVRTWQSAQRSGPARWASHDVHLAKPVREFLGPGSDTLELSIRLDAQLGVDPRAEIDALRALRDEGAVLQLVLGDELVADFFIASVDETWTRTDNRGVITLATAELKLEEYA